MYTQFFILSIVALSIIFGHKIFSSNHKENINHTKKNKKEIFKTIYELLIKLCMSTRNKKEFIKCPGIVLRELNEKIPKTLRKSMLRHAFNANELNTIFEKVLNMYKSNVNPLTLSKNLMSQFNKFRNMTENNNVSSKVSLTQYIESKRIVHDFLDCLKSANVNNKLSEKKLNALYEKCIINKIENGSKNLNNRPRTKMAILKSY